MAILNATASLAAMNAGSGATISGGNAPALNGGSAPPAPETHDDENAPANANAPAADSAGIPWDERIHSKTKAVNADGKWRGRRGVTAELVTQVESELKARGAAPMYMPSGPSIGLPPPQTHQGLPPLPPGPPQQFIPPAAIPSAPPPPAAVPSAPPVPGTVDFQGFMQHLTQSMQKRDPASGMPWIDNNYLIALTQKVSSHIQKPLSVITDISADQHAVDTAIWFMNADGKW